MHLTKLLEAFAELGATVTSDDAGPAPVLEPGSQLVGDSLSNERSQP
jgi:hypothetical protein